MDAVDLSDLYLDYLWDIAPPREIAAILRDAPDLASVGILVTTMPDNVDLVVGLTCREAARTRYSALTLPGSPDGPYPR